MKRTYAVRAASFVLLLVLTFISIYKLFNVREPHAEMMVNGYYDLEENSVDVVFVGTSHAIAYWQNAFAWEEYGIAASMWATPYMPYCVFKNSLIETGKTQDPKVYVVDITAFAQDGNGSRNFVYYLLRNMHFSKNRLDMVKSFCDYNDIRGFDRLPYYFPIIQFHSRWDALGEPDVRPVRTCYLNSDYQKDFLITILEGAHHHSTDARAEVPMNQEQALRDLITWAQEEGIEILFYAAPMLREEAYLAQLNRVCDIAEEYQVPTINFNDDEWFNVCEFDDQKDFYEYGHSNVYGSRKFTHVMGELLKTGYGLEDRRGQAGYEKWDEKAAAYEEYIANYIAEHSEQ